MIKRAFVAVVRLYPDMLARSRSTTRVLATLNVFVLGSVIILYILNMVISQIPFIRSRLNFNCDLNTALINYNILKMDSLITEPIPTEVLFLSTSILFVACIFFYFNYCLLKATYKQNLQSVINWLVFYSLQVVYTLICSCGFGLIKKSYFLLFLGVLNSIIHICCMLVVKQFYVDERKLVISRIVLRIPNSKIIKTTKV